MSIWCNTCVYSGPDGVFCMNKASEKTYVNWYDGSESSINLSLWASRADDGPCGPNAKLFEAKAPEPAPEPAP